MDLAPERALHPNWGATENCRAVAAVPLINTHIHVHSCWVLAVPRTHFEIVFLTVSHANVTGSLVHSLNRSTFRGAGCPPILFENDNRAPQAQSPLLFNSAFGFACKKHSLQHLPSVQIPAGETMPVEMPRIRAVSCRKNLDSKSFAENWLDGIPITVVIDGVAHKARGFELFDHLFVLRLYYWFQRILRGVQEHQWRMEGRLDFFFCFFFFFFSSYLCSFVFFFFFFFF